MTQATAVPLDKKYLESISKGLDAAFKGADEEPFDPHKERIVIFSDHHKGLGDPADDFRRCEHAYTSALGYYRRGRVQAIHPGGRARSSGRSTPGT